MLKDSAPIHRLSLLFAIWLGCMCGANLAAQQIESPVVVKKQSDIGQANLDQPNQPVLGVEEPSLEERLLALQAAVARLSEQFTTAVALGSITRRAVKNGRSEVQAYDLEIITDGPRYRVQLVEKPVFDAGTTAPNRRGEISDATSQPLQSQVVLFDGEGVYSIRYSEEGISAKAQFPFQQQAALRSAGYPFHPPLSLWQSFPLPTTTTELSLQPLQSDGLIVRHQAASYSARYYFFGDFDYDLRRIAYFANEQIRPFREVSYQWGEESGAHFVTRYSVRDRDPLDQTQSEVTIEFSSMEVNPRVPRSDALELSGMGLPVGTRFEDQRNNRQGKPAVLIWNGEKLQTEE